MIKIKRVYEDPDKDDGLRFLVDRLWPRGIKKEALQLDDWLKGLAPTNELRKWFHKDTSKWDEFNIRYKEELEQQRDRWEPVIKIAGKNDITLLYASRDTTRNHALVLKEFLEKKLEGSKI
jgi:uncharacterized protein YeaO (DUF488 family)